MEMGAASREGLLLQSKDPTLQALHLWHGLCHQHRRAMHRLLRQ